MAAKISAIVDVRTEQTGVNVYGLFKDCGPIASMHPWKKDGDADIIGHYFVVFDELSGAQRAAAVSAPAGVSVTPVNADPDLASAYMRLQSSSSSNSTSDATTTAPPTPTHGTASSSSRSSMNLDMPPPPVPFKVAAGAPGRAGHVNGEASTNRPEPSTFLRHITDTDNNSRSNLSSVAAPSASTSETDKAASIVTSDFSPLDVKLGMASMTPPTGFPTSLEVQYMGAPIRLDLTSLSPDNPRSLISLLTKLGAERASWMIAGAFFRRTGHPDAALSIASAMIDVFRKAGSPEQDLKPVFLFLSGCHSDLARHAPQDSSSSRNPINHAEEASRLLRKAYGTQRPDPTLDHPGSSQPPAGRAGEVPDTANTAPLNSKSNKRQRTANGSGDIGQIQMLQREIQSLRDRNAHLDKQQRKAEREAAEANAKLGAERVARKKAEVAATDASREADAARAAQRAAEDARNDVMRRTQQQGPPLPQRSSGMPGNGLGPGPPGHMHMHDRGKMGPGLRLLPPPLPSIMSRYPGPPPQLGSPANPPPIFMGIQGPTG